MKVAILNRPLRILLATNGLILLAGAMLGPIYALYVEEVGGSLMDASITGGIFALAAGITTLISGRYTDKVKNKDIIIILGYLIMGIGFFLFILVNSIWTLFIVQAIIGFVEAIYSPALDAIFTKHSEDEKVGRQWATWESLYYFSAAIGALIGGLIVTNFGFNPMFIFMGTLSLISAFYIIFLPRKTL